MIEKEKIQKEEFEEFHKFFFTKLRTILKDNHQNVQKWMKKPQSVHKNSDQKFGSTIANIFKGHSLCLIT